jgi:hypothetical protein
VKVTAHRCYTFDTGNFQHGVKHGFGESTYENGDVHAGNYENGQWHGMGRYTWADRRREHRGRFLNGYRNGPGVYTRNVQEVEPTWEDRHFVTNPNGAQTQTVETDPVGSERGTHNGEFDNLSANAGDEEPGADLPGFSDSNLLSGLASDEASSVDVES